MGAVARSATPAELAQAECCMQAALAGEDMRRIKMYFRLAVQELPEADYGAVADSLDAWARRLLMGQVSTRMAGRAHLACESLARVCTASAPRMDPLHSRYVHSFPPLPRDKLLVVEVKDPSSAWACSVMGYLARSVLFMGCDGVWRRTGVAVPEAGRRMAALFSHPNVMQQRRPPTAAAWTEGVPCVYTSVKSKCWENGRRICQRGGHCCVRRISSWYRFPLRG